MNNVFQITQKIVYRGQPIISIPCIVKPWSGHDKTHDMGFVIGQLWP